MELKVGLWEIVKGNLLIDCKAMVVLSTWVAMAYFTPKLKQNYTEAAVLKTVCILSFASSLWRKLCRPSSMALSGTKRSTSGETL